MTTGPATSEVSVATGKKPAPSANGTSAITTDEREYHGGQEWDTEHHVCDFSVTTNMYGPPKRALEAAIDAVHAIGHYPQATQETAKNALSTFLFGVNSQAPRILLGNGASELIDLLIQRAETGTYHTGPWDVQYKEYDRSVLVHRRHRKIPWDSEEKADLICIVNPCNPTGEYMPIEDLKSWLASRVKVNGTVIIDESMQPWLSRHFREDSMISQAEFVRSMLEKRRVKVFVVHSWTKIWCCPGIRLGSALAPSDLVASECQRYQVPWSVNVMAMAFLVEAVKDVEYMERTWRETTSFHKAQCQKLMEALKAVPERKQWKLKGHSFNSWIWIDTQDSKVADRAVELASRAGVPIRPGKCGYDRPTHIRIAVRQPTHFEHLIKALKPLFNELASTPC